MTAEFKYVVGIYTEDDILDQEETPSFTVHISSYEGELHLAIGDHYETTFVYLTKEQALEIVSSIELVTSGKETHKVVDVPDEDGLEQYLQIVGISRVKDHDCFELTMGSAKHQYDQYSVQLEKEHLQQVALCLTQGVAKLFA